MLNWQSDRVKLFLAALMGMVATKYQYNDLKQRGHLNFEVCIIDFLMNTDFL